MKARKLLLLVIALAVLTVFLQHAAFADEFSITGNAAGSNNQIDINQQQSTSIQQSNQSSVTNDVDVNANTGGNRVSGDGDSIKTGDARINVSITNQGNTNQANVPCCPTASPTPDGEKPAPSATLTPTPTTAPGLPPRGGDGGIGGGNGGGGIGGAGAPQVLGLAAASGEGSLETALVLAGTLCLLAGTYLVRQNHAHV